MKIEYTTSNAVSPEENILRGMFTYFLNLGGFDDRMKNAGFKPESARVDHVGKGFLNLHFHEIRDEFLAWIKSDELAQYLCNDSVTSAIRERFKSGQTTAWSHSPIDAILGARYKLITGFDRKRMPKDLKKSFYTKAYNRLVKFVEEYATTPTVRLDYSERNEDGNNPPKELSIEQWLQRACGKKARQEWFQSDNLKDIRNLYLKMVPHEPMDEIVEELMKQAAVAGVMLS